MDIEHFVALFVAFMGTVGGIDIAAAFLMRAPRDVSEAIG